MEQKEQNVFYPQLDSLRAIAVLLVIISHWFSKEHFLNRYSANGILGVTLFFVLSGFLITGILLKSKKKLDQGGTAGEAFKVFYIRRSLRIFPVYYLLLFLLLFLNYSDIRESFWWHFFYGSNFYFWIKDSFAGHLSHFWSLAVEEQFYLVWPAVILFTKRRYLSFVLFTGIVVGVLFRFFVVTESSDLARILMPGSLDSFCIGGLLAYGRNENRGWYSSYLRIQNIVVLLSLILLVVVHFPSFQLIPAKLFYALYLLFISLAFGTIINRVAYNVNFPVFKQILSNSILLYIGKISYGVYLFHNFIPNLYGIEIHGLPTAITFYVVQLLRLLILITVASLSWFLVEKPVLQLKKRFEFA